MVFFASFWKLDSHFRLKTKRLLKFRKFFRRSFFNLKRDWNFQHFVSKHHRSRTKSCGDRASNKQITAILRLWSFECLFSNSEDTNMAPVFVNVCYDNKQRVWYWYITKGILTFRIWKITFPRFAILAVFTKSGKTSCQRIKSKWFSALE